MHHGIKEKITYRHSAPLILRTAPHRALNIRSSLAFSDAAKVFALEPQLKQPLISGNITMGRHQVMAKRVAESMFTTQLMDNVGPEAQTMLANERTFLSWFRTGFQISAVGLVAAKLSTVDKTAVKAMTLMYILLGIIFVLVGLSRYIQVSVLMPDGKFPISGWFMVVTAIGGLGVFIATFVLLA